MEKLTESRNYNRSLSNELLALHCNDIYDDLTEEEHKKFIFCILRIENAICKGKLRSIYEYLEKYNE